jgi:hypothetical protein
MEANLQTIYDVSLLYPNNIKLKAIPATGRENPQGFEV